VNGSYGQNLDTGLFVTTGTQILAENTGGAALTFDGIDFSAGTIGMGGGTASVFHDATANTSLAKDGAYGSGGPATVSLAGLTDGNTYRVQLLIYDGRSNATIAGRNVKVDGVDQGVYANGTYNVTWGNGLLVTGTFVADAPSQNFTIESFYQNTSKGGQLNAILVHEFIPGAPDLSHPTVDAVTAIDAQATVTLSNTNADVTLFWDTVDQGTGSWSHSSPLGAQVIGPVTGGITGLSPGTRYFYRFHAVNTAPDPDTNAWSTPGTSFTTPHPPQVVHEEVIPTTPGTTYLVRFQVEPASGQSTVPSLQLEITGNALIDDISLPTPLPNEAAGVPYFKSFVADSAAATLRFTSVGGDVIIAGLEVAEPISATPATTPNARQQAQIDRRYGLFLHYGINTFHNEEWTDGTKPVSSYQPTALNVDQWVQTAYEAGMRYVLIISKHHDGFCMWNSAWTDYGIRSSSVPTDIVAAAAAACQKYGIKLALYYSLWDRHEPAYPNDEEYNQYMLRQLTELLGNYGPVCELWLDGGWDKSHLRWPSTEIYDLVRRLQPDCQVSTNWTIGTPGNIDTNTQPADQQDGYPIRYFPSDFRLGDPALPKFPDPKIFDKSGNSYYLPFEATVTLSSQNRWFYHTGDLSNKPVSQLAEYYYTATAQNNILVLNAPPDRSGRIRETERSTLIQLRDKLGLSPGVRLPRNVTGIPTATASSVWGNDVANNGPLQALDGNPTTRWASGPAGSTTASLELDFGSPRTFSRILIDEFEQSAGVGRITAFRLQSWDGSDWQTFHTGTTCGRYSLHDFPQRTTNKIRLIVDSATDATSIWEFQIHDAAHAFSTWRNQHFPVNGTSDPALAWNGDPDGDGHINLFEFALNDDPENLQPSGKTHLRQTAGSGSSAFVFTCPARSGAVFTGSPSPSAAIDGLVYQIQGSHALGDFAAPLVETSPITAGMPALDPGWTYRGFRLSQEDLTSGFIRIHLTEDSN
jgi:alpha-L-fucosidase